MEYSILLLLTLIFFLRFSSSSAPPPLFPKEAQPTKSGYLPINTNSSSALFYAFYEAQQPTTSLPQTPLLVWLQGGPGCSSMLGNFFELGPWLIDTDTPTLHPNPYSWNRVFGLIFIDNPIGTGFSIAAAPQDIPTDETTVAEHLYTAIKYFLASNIGFAGRPVYLTGESYAGKYVPAAGYYILQQNTHLPAMDRINLRGVAIGDGLTHPVAQVAVHAENAYFAGLINEQQKSQLEKLQDKAVSLTLAEKWSEAVDARNTVLDQLQNFTGLATLQDFRRSTRYDPSMIGVLLNNEGIKNQLGVKNGSAWEVCSDAVGQALNDDVMKSAKPMVEGILKQGSCRVLLYQGLFDIQDGVVGSEAWMKLLEWEGLWSFLNAERKVWEVNNGVAAGYVQAWGSLSHVVVSGAGHLVPHDQGMSAQQMIQGWVLKKSPFN